MRLERIEVFLATLPLKMPFRTAFGETRETHSVLVRVWSDGFEGWGEVAPTAGPHYSAEWAQGAFALIRDWLGPMLLGQDVQTGDELQTRLAPAKANPFAKAALDLAWWDLYGRLEQRPVWQIIGGQRPEVVTGEDLGLHRTVDDLLDSVAGAVAAGAPRIKLKIKPGQDVQMIRPVREAFPAQVMHVDCNSAYTLEDIAVFRALDELDLAMIEQPLAHDDIVDHAALQKVLKTPLCLDESIVSLRHARQAIALDAARCINIKAGRVGGLTNAIAIHDLCAKHELPCWVGFMIESSLGQSHNLALATLPNMQYPADIFPSDRFFARDLSRPVLVQQGPFRLRASDAPGFGCSPDPEQLERAVQHKAVLA